MKVTAVRSGKIYVVSAVVRSVNQRVPPVLNDGTFSAIFLICICRQASISECNDESQLNEIKYLTAKKKLMKMGP